MPSRPDDGEPAGVERPTLVLTPHDGEYERLAGNPVTADRIASARRLAAATRCVVLLKGPTTVVAEPAGRVRLVRSGDQRLATAGTGDVLAGIVGALCAQHVRPADGAALGAYLHGRAAALGSPHGLVAGDLPGLLPRAVADVAAGVRLPTEPRRSPARP
jgi:ADP-dependent NAD(P)H-hydrate dehydratase / NAD(P)H-hydrate epimerase